MYVCICIIWVPESQINIWSWPAGPCHHSLAGTELANRPTVPLPPQGGDVEAWLVPVAVTFSTDRRFTPSGNRKDPVVAKKISFILASLLMKKGCQSISWTADFERCWVPVIWAGWWWWSDHHHGGEGRCGRLLDPSGWNMTTWQYVKRCGLWSCCVFLIFLIYCFTEKRSVLSWCPAPQLTAFALHRCNASRWSWRGRGRQRHCGLAPSAAGPWAALRFLCQGWLGGWVAGGEASWCYGYVYMYI